MIRIEHLRKEYSGVTPLADVNARIETGDVISIIGPSGTGKSTLLRMLNQLEKPTSGKIFFHDECITDPGCDISAVRQRMGMVFQSFNLYETLTAVENIMAAPEHLKGLDRQAAYDKAMDLLEQVGLADKALSFPDELSGGQKQRVAIARAIAMNPEILLLDEPTSALDPKMVNEVQLVIADLARSGMTMVIVTHEMNFAKRVSNRIFYMDEGTIYEEGTPKQIFNNPQRPKTREFVRKVNQLHLTLSRNSIDLEELFSQTRSFCRDNTLSRTSGNKLTLAMEELVADRLYGMLPAGEQIDISLDYDPDSDDVRLQASYGAQCLDPLEGAEELSIMILRNVLRDYRHTYEQGRNSIVARIEL